MGRLIVMVLLLTSILWIVSELYSCSDEPDIIEYEQYLNDRVK